MLCCVSFPIGALVHAMLFCIGHFSVDSAKLPPRRVAALLKIPQTKGPCLLHRLHSFACSACSCRNSGGPLWTTWDDQNDAGRVIECAHCVNVALSSFRMESSSTRYAARRRRQEGTTHGAACHLATRRRASSICCSRRSLAALRLR